MAIVIGDVNQTDHNSLRKRLVVFNLDLYVVTVTIKSVTMKVGNVRPEAL